MSAIQRRRMIILAVTVLPAFSLLTFGLIMLKLTGFNLIFIE
ncbi:MULTISPECIES: hypothetical protein [unclassified Nostoc]|nr:MULTISPECIES: hypothetical protein [unclassified Nostoc]